MAAYSNGGLTSPDIWMVVSLVAIATISCLLNPLVFRHNINKKKSLPRDLYLALSATDFLSSVFLTSFFCYGILQPREESCHAYFKLKFNSTACETAYYFYTRPSTIWEKVLSIIAWELFFTPTILITAIALSRWYTIRYPLRNLNKNMVKIITAAMCLFLLTFYIVTLVFDDEKRTGKSMMIQMAFNPAPFGIRPLESFGENVGLIMTVSATVASFLIIHHISTNTKVPRSNRKAEKRRRSAIKVALLNAGSTLCMVFAIGRVIIMKAELKFRYSTAVYHTTLINFLPIILSSYNSLVYVLLTHKDIFHKTQIRVASIRSFSTGSTGASSHSQSNKTAI